MSKENTALQTEINKIVSDALNNDDAIAAIIKTKINDAITSAVESLFNWGEAKHAIEAKLKEVMVPAIESYDFSKYVQKLDIVMKEILHSPAVICNNKILSNFKTIMCPPDVKTLTLKQLFIEYCDYVAKNLDTNGRDIDYDSGDVEYEPIECIMELEDITSTWTASNNDEHYRLLFHVGEENAESEYGESLNVDIELRRWRWMPSDEYDIRIAIDPNKLNHMSDFESFVYSLCMANIHVKLDSTENLKSGIYEDELVTPDKTPEPDYH